MVFGGALLLLINLAYVQLLIHPDNGCDFAERLSSKQASSFKNPHWPATYAPGTTCRWTFDCPIWYACRLRCLDVGLPQTDDCYMDKLLVSGSGNQQLEGAQVFCGRTEINFRSVGSRLTLALVTNRLSPGGRFRCTIRSEPWTQPWFMSPCTPNPMLANRNGSSLEEGEVSQKQKIITSADTNHRRLNSDLPHTGLLQSRKPYTEPELEKNPHIKNVESEPYANHSKANSSYVKFIKADSSNTKRPKAKLFIGNAESDVLYADTIRSGSPYLDNFEDGSPRLQNPEPRSPQLIHTLAESSSFDLDQGVQGLNENLQPKISHVRHIKAESQHGKSSKLRFKSQLPYLDNVEYATPHAAYGRDKSTYVRYIQAETSPADLDQDEHMHTENLEQNVSHVRHIKAESQHGKTKQLKSHLPYLDNVEDATPHIAYRANRIPYARHAQAESPQSDSVNSLMKKDRLYADNLEVNILPYINDAELGAVHVRRAKAAYPHYKSFRPHKKLDSYVESVEAELSHTKDKLLKNPYSKLVNSRASPPENFQSLGTLQQAFDVHQHIQKSNSNYPRLRRVKSGLPYAKNFNPDQKVNIPYLDNLQEGTEIVQAEPVRIKPLKVEIPYNRQTPPEEPRRKHKVVSHVKRTQQGKYRGLKQKYVHEASRRIRHEIIRTPLKAKQLPEGVPRITHQRTGLPHNRRVRTHLKRVTPYKGDKSTREKQSYF